MHYTLVLSNNKYPFYLAGSGETCNIKLIMSIKNKEVNKKNFHAKGRQTSHKTEAKICPLMSVKSQEVLLQLGLLFAHERHT